MGAAETLDGRVSAPTGFEQIVVAARLVLGGETRVIAAPGAACIGEDQDFLLVPHEGVSLGKVCSRRTALDSLATVRVDDDAPAASRHLGDRIGPEVPEDLIKGGPHNRPAAEQTGRATGRERVSQ